MDIFVNCKLKILINIRESYTEMDKVYLEETNGRYTDFHTKGRIYSAAIMESLWQHWGLISTSMERYGNVQLREADVKPSPSLVDVASSVGAVLLANPDVGHILTYDELLVVSPGLLIVGWYEI